MSALFTAVPFAATCVVLFATHLLARVEFSDTQWNVTTDRCRVFALVATGMSPFIYWWARIPEQPFFLAAMHGLILVAIVLLLGLNRLLVELAGHLNNDLELQEAKLFAGVNRWLLTNTLVVTILFFIVYRLRSLPSSIANFVGVIDQAGLFIALFLIVLPLALTMTIVWKLKEAVLEALVSGR